ncbi:MULTISPECIES: YitT family protein [Flavobacteriaceae]|uniref:YitT family protein n=1 Tax=Flavobacteriaceae TaxID=49546 RepID=UPI001492A9E0|nr:MULTISPECIES: YitT family protein [Allomuricauda]MDC6366477.1 YitT family protein [Muricauda sp. AC10]
MNKTKQLLSETFQICIGILLASIGLKAFLLPNGFLDGGVTGIAILISQLFDLNISIVLLISSIPFLILGWSTLTKKIVLKSFLSISALAIFIHFENFTAVTEDKLLIAIFGGLFLGAGIGITIKNGAVLDGSEILGIFVNNRYGISIGKVILLFNIVLFSITAFLISIEVSMYSVLTFLITAKVIDLMMEGFEDYVGLMIVSENPNEIESALVKEIGIGITIYKGSNGYGQRGKKANEEIIHTVINRIDINRTYRLIEKLDNKAFIIEFDVNNVKGGILKKYLS